MALREPTHDTLYTDWCYIAGKAVVIAHLIAIVVALVCYTQEALEVLQTFVRYLVTYILFMAFANIFDSLYDWLLDALLSAVPGLFE